MRGPMFTIHKLTQSSCWTSSMRRPCRGPQRHGGVDPQAGGGAARREIVDAARSWSCSLGWCGRLCAWRARCRTVYRVFVCVFVVGTTFLKSDLWHTVVE